MQRSEAFRRSQRDRKRAKYLRVLRDRDAQHYNLKYRSSLEELKVIAAKMAEAPQMNQCQCCCNIRRSNWYSKEEKLTMQERRVMQEADFELSEVSRFN
jgi:hypothetical protein